MLTHLVKLDREVRVAAAVQNAANYDAANVIALANAGDRFDDPASDPEGVIDQALNGVLIYRPNTSTMSVSVWNALRKHPKVVRAVKGTLQGAGKITRQEFVDYFEIKTLNIGEGYVNTARKGQPANLQRVWGKSISFAYLDRSARPEGGVTWGFSPVFGTRVAGTITDANAGGIKGGDVIRVSPSPRDLRERPAMRPSVGRIVHYYTARTERQAMGQGEGHCAAVVTRLEDAPRDASSYRAWPPREPREL